MDAGLPILPRLAGESKSYAERLFQFPGIGALDFDDATKALQDPVEKEGTFHPAAITEIFRLTCGYPYFIQEWGYQAWNLAEGSPIEVDVVKRATEETISRLDENFFRVRFGRLTPSEKTFLRAMAELGGELYRIRDIARVLDLKVGSLSPRRAKLIHRG